MPVATTPSPRPASQPKMEERKRPAVGGADDLAPPSKRHHSINGSKPPKSDPAEQTEEFWVENYQKGAIYRQLQETKREKQEVEARADQLQSHVTYRDDQIRLIETWWDQMLQELELLVDPVAPAPTGPIEPPYITGTTFKDAPSFQNHLNEKTEALRKRAEGIINRIASSRGELTPNIADLEARVNSLLAQQKDYLVQLDKAHHENEQLTEDLNKKTLQALKAERRTQRLRSAQVQKLEQQFMAKATQQPDTAETENDEALANKFAADTTLAKLEAALATQKEHLETAQKDLQALQKENMALKARKSEESANETLHQSDVFKQFKVQNEDLINKINHLEATKTQLRDEVDKLQTERTAFKSKLSHEASARVADLERQLQDRDRDVTRLRTARDEWFAKANVLETSSKEEDNAKQQLKELLALKEDREKALELEVQRLSDTQPMPDADADVDVANLSPEELLTKYKKLQQDFESINKELPALQKAYQRSKTLASGKTMDFVALEDRASTLLAEKQKVEQKYFSLRRDTDLRDHELGALRSQCRESSKIVTQLKEVEAQCRALASNLEKQLTDAHQANMTIAAENKKLEAQILELTRQVDASRNQVKFLTSQTEEMAAEQASLKELKNQAELETAQISAHGDQLRKELAYWKKRKLPDSAEETELLRKRVECTICERNFKDTMLTTCGHVFCGECVDRRIASRIRKCPNCGKAFDRNDVKRVHF